MTKQVPASLDGGCGAAARRSADASEQVSSTPAALTLPMIRATLNLSATASQ